MHKRLPTSIKLATFINRQNSRSAHHTFKHANDKLLYNTVIKLRNQPECLYFEIFKAFGPKKD